ncbi:TOMM propeptide domain-containing protein [Tenacibaculum sp. SZ-18]|uniref:NHLP leader peptide family RiPP precursor n=1 Tax=Tenacibaculum sp. SZ-18 TaxID=754423 RepID=UPI000C2D08DB|nr:NHLP leader peptide family RiPP precursor [Tenacibaculum sp. SZ-18]AUC16924.1 TOMM propeptide domain-containing protein [Tenacibaculum sp. SZ-18]
MKSTKENQLFNQLVEKAWGDENFKNELIANPVDAIEKLTGKKLDLPEGKKIVVRDQTNESSVYINIPAKPNIEDLQLTEEQLEAVAGGADLGDLIDVIKDILTPTIPTFPTIL